MITRAPRLVSRALAVILTAGALALMPSAANAVDGAQSSGDSQFPNVGNGGYDVSHYDIDLRWDPAPVPSITQPTIQATTTITAATTGETLASFSLDFKGLTVDSINVNGSPATHTRVQNLAQTKYKLIITPTAPVSGAFTTVVAYSGTPTSHVDPDGSTEGWMSTSDGATFLNQPIGSMTGFPNNNTPMDKATYDFSLDIPSSLGGGPSAAVANGELVSHTAAGDRTTWVWDQQEQMASELSMVSIGRYDMTARNLPLASGRNLPEWTFIDPAASGAFGAATAANNLKSYIDFFEARYGPYPGNSTGIVVDSAAIGYALETQDRAFFPNSVGTSTNIHETMHQWFGDNVSPEFWSDLWLSEGPATYAEVQLPNEAGTETSFFNQWSTTAPSSPTWTTPAADPDDDDPSDLYDAHVYDRGAMALEALRTAIGATTFADLMEEWQTRYGGTAKGADDFIALAEELSGRQLDAFFQDWIFDNNKPVWPGRFNLSLATTPASGPVAPGAAVTYAVSVTNTGQVALTGAVVTLDLTDVLDNATIHGALPANTSLAGSILTWTVPSTALGATSTLSLPVTVAGAAPDASTLGATVEATTLGSTCRSCTASLSVDPAGLASQTSTPTPTVAGTARVGQTLAAAAGTWDAGVALAYQWLGDGTPIPGATSSAYPLTANDLGKRISVAVTGTRFGYVTVSRTSTQTFPVAKGRFGKPPKPKIKGSAVVGNRLRVVTGAWPDGVRLKIQWYADGKRVGGANGKKLLLAQSFRGRRISVKVTGTKQGYRPGQATSTRTAAVV